MGEHGCDDVGVVYLSSADGGFAAEFDQCVGDLWTVFEDFEGIEEPLDVEQRFFECDGVSPILRSGDSGQVFSDDLPADSQWFLVVSSLLDPVSSCLVVGSFDDLCIDQRVGIDEHYVSKPV